MELQIKIVKLQIKLVEVQIKWVKCELSEWNTMKCIVLTEYNCKRVLLLSKDS